MIFPHPAEALCSAQGRGERSWASAHRMHECAQTHLPRPKWEIMTPGKLFEGPKYTWWAPCHVCSSHARAAPAAPLLLAMLRTDLEHLFAKEWGKKTLIGALFYFNSISTILYQINGDAQPQSQSPKPLLFRVVGSSHWGICGSSALAFHPRVEREVVGSTKPAHEISITILMLVVCCLGSV